VLDQQNRVWVGTINGVVVQDPNGAQLTYTTANSKLAHKFVQAIAFDQQGRAWIGTRGGLNVLAPDGNWTTYTPRNSGLASIDVTALAIDKQGRMWIGATSGLNTLTPDGQWITYTPANSQLPHKEITTLAIDEQSRVWVGSYEVFSMIAPNGNWAIYTSKQSGASLGKIKELVTDKQGRTWVIGGSIFDELIMFAPDGSHITYPNLGNFIEALAIDAQDRVWVGTYDGISVLSADGRWTSYNPYNSGLISGGAYAIAIDKQGQLWIGSAGGIGSVDNLTVFNDSINTPVQLMNTLASTKAMLNLVWLTNHRSAGNRFDYLPKKCQSQVSRDAVPSPSQRYSPPRHWVLWVVRSQRYYIFPTQRCL
jgi:ligand-binding sensor domain-containing protein